MLPSDTIYTVPSDSHTLKKHINFSSQRFFSNLSDCAEHGLPRVKINKIYHLIKIFDFLIGTMASALYESLRPKSEYVDKSRKLPPEEYQRLLGITSTVYIGNLSNSAKALN